MGLMKNDYLCNDKQTMDIYQIETGGSALNGVCNFTLFGSLPVKVATFLLFSQTKAITLVYSRNLQQQKLYQSYRRCTFTDFLRLIYNSRNYISLIDYQAFQKWIYYLQQQKLYQSYRHTLLWLQDSHIYNSRNYISLIDTMNDNEHI